MVSKVQISILVAVSRNNVIGRDGDLPWRLSADLRRFKRLTMGHCLIMGRRTYESIGRPLPGRVSIVLTRQPQRITPQDDLLLAHSLEDAMQQVPATPMDQQTAFVIGGADLYRQALPLANRLYLTRVDADVPGDVTFPEVDWNAWERLEQQAFPADSHNDHPHRFEIYQRACP